MKNETLIDIALFLVILLLVISIFLFASYQYQDIKDSLIRCKNAGYDAITLDNYNHAKCVYFSDEEKIARGMK